jgi:hypothetical protein
MKLWVFQSPIYGNFLSGLVEKELLYRSFPFIKRSSSVLSHSLVSQPRFAARLTPCPRS